MKPQVITYTREQLEQERDSLWAVIVECDADPSSCPHHAEPLTRLEQVEWLLLGEK